MKRHRMTGARERCLERVHVRRRLERIALGKVPEVRRFRAREVVVAGSVEKNDRADVFRIGGGKIERIVGAERETDDGQPAIRPRRALRDKRRGLRNVGLGVHMAGIERFAQRLGVGNGGGDFAVIEIRREGDEPGLRQARAKRLDGVVQSPPGVQHQHGGSRAARRRREKARRLL